MNGTNVDYYVSGFDTAGKRVGLSSVTLTRTKTKMQ